MALPTSGQLALSAIRDEFGAGTTSNVSLRTLSAAAGLSVPDGFNEFYGLANYLPPQYISGATSVTGSGTQASPYIVSDSSITNFLDTYYYTCGEFADWGIVEKFYKARTNDIIFKNRTATRQRAHVSVSSFSSNANNSCLNCTYFGVKNTFMRPFSSDYQSGCDSNNNSYNAIINEFINTQVDYWELKDYNNTNSQYSVWFERWEYKESGEDYDCDYVADVTTVQCPTNLSGTNFSFSIWFEPF
jgi:hypothetical protein